MEIWELDETSVRPERSSTLTYSASCICVFHAAQLYMAVREYIVAPLYNIRAEADVRGGGAAVHLDFGGEHKLVHSHYDEGLLGEGGRVQARVLCGGHRDSYIAAGNPRQYVKVVQQPGGDTTCHSAEAPPRGRAWKNLLRQYRLGSVRTKRPEQEKRFDGLPGVARDHGGDTASFEKPAIVRRQGDAYMLDSKSTAIGV